MRRLSLVCLLFGAVFGTVSWAQNKPAASAPQAPVAGNAVVITIKGLCAGPAIGLVGSTTKTPCQTVITREKFEKLAAAIQPNMTPTTKRQLAENFPRLLVMSREAEHKGLDKRERYEELVAFARLQILSQELMRDIRDKAADVPTAEVEAYYHQHSADFEKATFERVLVPTLRQGEPSTGATSTPEDVARLQKENHEEMVKEAERIHARAAAGEDFVKLQQAAYDAAAVNATIPPTKLNWRRGSLPKAHLSVFDLKPGEISSVISDPTGHYIYKLDSKEIAPLEEATPEIRAILQKQRLNDMMKAVQESATTELNQEYFGGGAATPSTTPAGGVKPDDD
jgi:parvulin-like peptidyl-prolyl isomerase